jgi:hypothetical protein
MRSLKTVLVSVGLISTAMAIVPQAKASAFTGFNFSTNAVIGNPTHPTKGDITLQSVTWGSRTVSNFDLVNSASIHTNSYTLGPASSDRGDLVSGSCARNEMPSAADIVSSLGNLNLNCIVDTEDNMGTSIIDVFFDPNKTVNTFFFFERGMNSNLQVQGIDANGGLVGNFTIMGNVPTPMKQWKPTGYSIDTMEINNSQRLGSYGLSSAVQLKGLRIMSQIGFNGPDFKVVATRVPEPATMLGLGAVSGTAVLLRRRKQKVQG